VEVATNSRAGSKSPQGFFAAPPPLTDVAVRPVTSLGRSYQRLFFDSEYEPWAGEPGRQRWLSYTANDREYGLMLRHREPRPWLVCVHGAEMGRAALDLALFRAWHLHSDLGLNVVLPVFPLHRPLGGACRRAPRSPVRTCSTWSTVRLRPCGISGACCRGSAPRSLTR